MLTNVVRYDNIYVSCFKLSVFENRKLVSI